MDNNNIDFSEIGSSKLETRYIINFFSINFINAMTVLDAKGEWYMKAHKTMDFIEATLLGYVAQKASFRFEELRKEFNEKRAKLTPVAIRKLDKTYLDLLYKYNLKRYTLVRTLLTRYNLDLYKNKVVAKD